MRNRNERQADRQGSGRARKGSGDREKQIESSILNKKDSNATEAREAGRAGRMCIVDEWNCSNTFFPAALKRFLACIIANHRQSAQLLPSPLCH